MNYRELIYSIEKYGVLRTVKMEVREFFYQVFHVLRFLPILWKDKDYDRNFLLRLIHFKLDLMSRHIAVCSMGAKASRTKRASMRKMRIIMCHIDHYLEIDKYIPYIEEKEERDFGEAPPGVMRRYKQQDMAEQWHWEQIWTKLNMCGQRFWC
jgi:hypothetical protein